MEKWIFHFEFLIFFGAILISSHVLSDRIDRRCEKTENLHKELIELIKPKKGN